MANSPLRIVFSLDSLGVGGTEMNAVRVAERLDPARYNVSVACFSGSGKLRPRLDAAGIRVDEFPVRSLYGRSMVQQGFRFVRFLRREKVDILHAHDRYGNVFATLWGRIARTPVIITSKRWDTISRVHGAGNRVAFHLSHRVLANSSRVGESLVKGEWLPDERVVVVPNFVDESAFARPDESWLEGRRAELALSPGAMVVGIVANLRSIKDHATLLRAIALVKERVPEVVLVMVGDGSERSALQQLAQDLGIADRVRFAGTWPNIPNPHALFDISVLSSLGEGFPNTIVEAMAAGRPVVATDVGGVPDAVDDGITGILVPRADHEAMAEALGDLMTTPARRAGMGSAGLVAARERFAASRVMPMIGDLYDALARGA